MGSGGSVLADDYRVEKKMRQVKLWVVSLVGLWLACSLAFAQSSSGEDYYGVLRERMVSQQIESGRHGIAVRDPLVLEAMRSVPRHEFVPESRRHLAYGDFPVPIGAGQTISQPFIVALMTELARVNPGSRVLEIGTGSGYQAAVLSLIADEVYSIEIIEELALQAQERLSELGFSVQMRIGDGYLGWPEKAPFDVILVTAAAPRLPQPLVEQLSEGGRLVIPLGEVLQELFVFHKSDGKLTEEAVIPVRFVPMMGIVQDNEQDE